MKKLSILTALLCISLAAGAQYSLIRQDVNSQTGSGAVRYTSFKDKTYFIADDGTHGYELWWSDGHSFGMVADINPGAADAFNPNLNSGHNLCVLGNSLYFVASDSQDAQLWEYNGNTAPQKRTNIGSPYIVRGAVTPVGNSVYFKALDVANSRDHIFSYNPQTHVYLLTSAAIAYNVEPIVAVNGKLVYAGMGAGGVELHEYDPIADTSWIWDLNPSSGSGPNGFYMYKNMLFFLAASNDHGRELYQYNGFSEPRRITDIVPGGGYSFGNGSPVTERMAMYNNKLYFMAYTQGGPLRRQLFSYDLLNDNVQQVVEMKSNSSARGMAVYGGKLYMAADSNNGQRTGLFMYDGKDLRHFSSIGFNTFTVPHYLTESNGKLFFSDWDNSSSGSFETYVFTDSVALDVPDVQAGEGVNVYPNPASDNVYFAFSLKQAATLTVRITDVQGRLAIRVTETFNAGRNTLTAPMHRHASGVYTYTITNEEGEVLGQGKLVKQ